MRFGTDGVRGPAGRAPIDVEGARRIGRAAATQGPVVWVARDTRPSGVGLAEAVLEGAAEAGAGAWDAGVLPSAGLAAAVAKMPGSVGVMVTASHNPVGDNGFKVLLAGGHKPDDAQTARLEAALAGSPRATDPGMRVDMVQGAWEAYEAAFLEAVGDVSALRGRQVVVDLAHGAAAVTGPTLLHALGLSWRLVGDGSGIINDGVGSENPEALVTAVRAQGAAAGIAVDGDADRCLLVTETGAVVPGDALTALLARHRGDSAVGVTVMSTAALPGWLPDVRIETTPVGDRHLAALIRSGSVSLGGEDSGHVLFADGLPGGDGLLTGLRALQAAFAQADTVSASVSDLVPFPRRLTKVRVADRPPLDEVQDIQTLVAEGEQALGAGGRVFLRYSGTEPVLRVLVEGPEPEMVARVSAQTTTRCAEVLG